LEAKILLGEAYIKTNRFIEGFTLLVDSYAYTVSVFGAQSVPTGNSKYKIWTHFLTFDGPQRQQMEAMIRSSLKGDVRCYFMRANLLAGLDLWSESTEDLRAYLRAFPEDSEAWHQLAANLVQARDMNAYRDHSRRSVERFSNATDPFVLNRIAKDALILPGSGVDLQVLADMAWRSLSAGTNISSHLVAIAEYRLGRYASALAWADRSSHAGVKVAGVELETNIIAAMAREQLGDHDGALAGLQECERRRDRCCGWPGCDWLDGVFGRAMLEEATILIKPGKSGITPNAK
jgi:hypothetical protein